MVGFFSLHTLMMIIMIRSNHLSFSDSFVDLITDIQQAAGVQVVRLEDDGGGKEGNGEDTGDVVIGGDKDMV